MRSNYKIMSNFKKFISSKLFRNNETIIRNNGKNYTKVHRKSNFHEIIHTCEPDMFFIHTRCDFYLPSLKSQFFTGLCLPCSKCVISCVNERAAKGSSLLTISHWLRKRIQSHLYSLPSFSL